MERIGLVDAIRSLRAELAESILASKGEELRFKVGEIELEFQVEVERSAEASGGIRFWVVEFGGKGTHGSTTTHTVRVPLTPVTGPDGNRPVFTGLKGDDKPE